MRLYPAPPVHAILELSLINPFVWYLVLMQAVNRPFPIFVTLVSYKYLTYDAAKIIIHAFLFSKLHYCNSLLYGLPSYLIQELQHVENSAARVVNQCPRFCHITPVLRDLHWLPVSFRVEFKIMLIAYKVPFNCIHPAPMLDPLIEIY